MDFHVAPLNICSCIADDFAGQGYGKMMTDTRSESARAPGFNFNFIIASSIKQSYLLTRTGRSRTHKEAVKEGDGERL